MKQIDFTKAAEEVAKLSLEAIDRFVDEIVTPLSDVGSPENLIGKKYSEWTPQDLQLLIAIYGQSDDSPLARLIFSREYSKVKQMEAEEHA